MASPWSPIIFLKLFFLGDFYPWAKHSQSCAAACFLLALPVLRLAVSAAGSARLRTPFDKGEKAAEKEKLKKGKIGSP